VRRVRRPPRGPRRAVSRPSVFSPQFPRPLGFSADPRRPSLPQLASLYALTQTRSTRAPRPFWPGASLLRHLFCGEPVIVGPGSRDEFRPRASSLFRSATFVHRRRLDLLFLGEVRRFPLLRHATTSSSFARHHFARFDLFDAIIMYSASRPPREAPTLQCVSRSQLPLFGPMDSIPPFAAARVNVAHARLPSLIVASSSPCGVRVFSLLVGSVDWLFVRRRSGVLVSSFLPSLVILQIRRSAVAHVHAGFTFFLSLLSGRVRFIFALSPLALSIARSTTVTC